MKSVTFKKPAAPASAEDWVRGPASDGETAPAAPADPGAPAEPVEPMKRLTIDVPLSLHIRLKVGCALQGLKIADVVRELIEQKFPPRSS